MKLVILIIVLMLSASAQSYLAKVPNAYVLPNSQGHIIQYGFSLALGGWFPAQSSHRFDFSRNADDAEIITVHGVSKLYLDSHSAAACPSGCSYSGVFTTWNSQPQIETLTLPDSSTVMRVSGTLTGTFRNGQNSTSGVTARFYFEAYPSIDGTFVNAPGALIVEIGPN